MTDHHISAPSVRFALNTIQRFLQAQQLASGDTLDIRIRQIVSNGHSSAYASEVWELGEDCRYLIKHYGDYVECFEPYREQFGTYFDTFKQLRDRITEICAQLGIGEIRRSLEHELSIKANEGAFRRDDAIFLHAPIINPAIHSWGGALVKSEIVSKVIPALDWPPGIIPRELELLDPQFSRGSSRVIVSVLVGEKIKG